MLPEITQKSFTRAAVFFILNLLASGCAPFDKIYSHEFASGYYKLKNSEKNAETVFVDLEDDSLIVYPVSSAGRRKTPDIHNSRGATLESIRPGDFLYNNTFVRTSADVDLSTVLIKYRPPAGDVPLQIGAHVNGVGYIGFRKDYFRLKSSVSELNEFSTRVRHIGFDAGIFAGLGITPVNPTVTLNRTIQEYEGMVFQKGVSIFATYESLSVGLALGFDNLIGQDRKIWIYNQKPWLGLVLGIANF